MAPFSQDLEPPQNPGRFMVMNAEVDWAERCKVWSEKQTDYFSAQQALDDAMSLYLQAKGPPPTCQVLNKVGDLRVQLFEARAVVDEFIAAHAVDDQQMQNLPGHE